MSNVIKEYQEALNTTPPLKVNIAPAFTPPAGVQDPASPPTPIIPASAFPSAPTQASPIPEQPQIQPTTSSLLEVPPTPTGDTALSYGETVSRLSAQSAQEIQKILAESGQPKPNEVQKQLLGSSNPIQIDPKLTSQNNPFKSSREPRNAAERLAFEPPVLPNGMRNAFSNPNARAAIAAGISKGEYLDYIQSLRDKGAQYVGFGERDVNAGGYTDTLGNRVIETEDFTGLSADQIRQKMKDRTGFYSTQRAFNQSFLPFLGDDRGSLETLFGVLALPANLVRGVTADTVIRPAAALISGGFDVEAIKKAYEEMRPTRGGTFTGAAILGEQFSSMAVTDRKTFNPFAVVRDDKNLPQALVGFGLDVLLDPLNAPVGQAFNRFRRSTVTPPHITPEVLPPVRELPPSNVAGVLPEARTVDVPSVVDSPITPRTPPTPERVLVTPNREAPSRVYLPENTVAQDATTSQTAVGRTVAQSDTAAQNITTIEGATQVNDITVPQKRAEPELAASYDSLARYEPSEVVFPVPREPYTPPVVRYHGSSSPVTELKNDFFNKDNIYGNGFYTTRDRSIAETYQEKGASEGVGEGYLYQVHTYNDKLFNLDDVIPAQIRESVRLNAPNSGRLGVLYKEAERLLNGGKSYGLGGKVVTSTAELFDAVRIFSKRVTVETGEDGFAKFVDSFKPELQKSGYTGFTHEGGRLTRGKRHQVDILWNPETSVKLSQLNLPKVEPEDIQLYNNVTALFNDSPQLPIIQQAVREVVEQKPVTVELPKNPILQEVVEYGRTGELTPNIAVLKGATPDEVRAIVQDKLEVMRETPFVVPRLEVQPITVPKLEFDITRQVPRRPSIVETAVAKLPELPTPQSRSMPDILSKRLESDRVSIPESSNKAEALQFAEKSIRGEVPRNDRLIADNQSEIVKNITRQSGNPEEAVALAEGYYRAAKRIMDSEDTQIFINVNQEYLPDVFKNGLKNVYDGTTDEFKASKAYLRPRLGLEKIVNGIPNNPDIPSYARPVYGYVDSVKQIETQQFPRIHNDSGHLGSRGYGDTTIQLKPSAKDRSSFTVGDSLNANGGQTASVPISGFESASPWASAFYREGADKARQLPEEVSDLVHFRNYLEAQVYGGVNIDDIAALHFRKEPLPEVLAMAFDRDIRVFVNGVEIPNVKPVPTSKPVVVTDSAITTVADLQEAAKGIGTLGEVSQWSVRGDFITPLKEVLNAVDDLGLDVLNTLALSRMVKGGIGKLSNKTVEGVAASLQKVELKTAEDIAKSIFNALWRKSTPDQKEIILGKISATRLEQLGLERVQTKITPPTLPTLRHEQAVMYHGAGSQMSRLDDSFFSTENIYGNGLYTTADRGVANSYRKKNATAYSKEGYLYSLTEKSPVKLYDLDQPFNKQSVEGKAIIEHLKRLQRSGDDYIETLADGMLDELSQGFTLGRAMDTTRRFNEEGSEVLTNFIDSFREPLSKSGYGGYTHQGGVLTGSKRHQVNIYWKTEDVLELKQLEPTPNFSDSYQVVNDSKVELSKLREEMLLAQGYDRREAVMTAKRGHPISEEIANTGAVSDRSLEMIVKNRELYSDYPSEQKWSSKMLQQIWEVATPEQKAYLMTNLDNIEKLGLERIARSNVIDDHLPPERVFDTPC
ncbi:MAG: hypothetical protein AN484_07085 [Aphanizomenon flos-aquae WA102]|uniref:Uncharacterized protein n=1 Tax=Aphanizomenon flos-aquae WA102 TaxID=1710896 RepID=A0A1B7X4Z9_APHFL|nr:MAG: hypothetical protein AN484_07085 [Aphanizomenon flos-aquae WA102]